MKRRQPRFTKKHLHELRVPNKRRQNPLETNTLLEPTRPTPNRQKRLGHPADTQPFDQLVVAKTFGGHGGHEASKVPQPDARERASTERFFERAEAKLDVARGGGGAHQADSPGLALEIAEASTDFEAVVG